MKKSLTVLSLVLLCAVFIPGTAMAAIDGDFEYTDNGDGTCTVTGYIGSDADITIPNALGGLTVTHIGEGALRSKSLDSVVLPINLISIGTEAFFVNNLTSITIPNDVTTIEYKAFCANELTSVTIPNNVTTIGDYAFYSNELKSITIPNGVTTIGDSAFCKNRLTSVTIPNSVRTIGDDAFRENRLTSVVLPSNLTRINAGSFCDNRLTSITIPSGVTRIYDSAFRDNSQMTSVTFEAVSSLFRIDNNAFRDNGLTSLSIPASLKEIHDNAFSGNDIATLTFDAASSLTNIHSSAFRDNDLTTLTLPSSLTRVDNLAFDGNDITSLTIPSSVTYIGGGAFNGNAIITQNGSPSNGIVYRRNNDGSVDTTTIVSYGGASDVVDFIPNSVRMIGSSSFEENGLTSITIPLGVTRIGGDALKNNNLDDVTIPLSVIYIGNDATVLNNFTTFQLPTGSGTWDGSNGSKYNGGDSVPVSPRYTRINEIPNRISTVNAADTAVTKPNTAYTLDLSTIFEDGNSDPLTYEVNIDGTGYIPAAENYSYPATTVGTFELVFMANDGYKDSTDTYTVTLTVNTIPNRISTVNATDTSTVDVNAAYTLDLSTIFEDIDGHSLNYKVDIDGAGNVAAAESYSFTPTSAGEYVLVFIANDTYDDSTDTYTVTVTAVNGNHTLTYDANNGTGADTETHTGTTIFALHDGAGFERAGYLIDGWTIDGVDYMLAELYQMPNADKTAYALWTEDTDRDGVSDDDENQYGSSPNDPRDKPDTGTIRVTVLNSDGTPAGGLTAVLNSTPQTEITDANGQVVFNDVVLGAHTLTLRNGTNTLGTYEISFELDSEDAYVITDDASTDSIGALEATVTERFMMIDIDIQHNAMTYWELADADITTEADPIINPRTGDAGRANLWVMIAMIPAMLAGGVLFIRRKNKKICAEK